MVFRVQLVWGGKKKKQNLAEVLNCANKNALCLKRKKKESFSSDTDVFALPYLPYDGTDELKTCLNQTELKRDQEVRLGHLLIKSESIKHFKP